jgi:hypothetical protein
MRSLRCRGMITVQAFGIERITIRRHGIPDLRFLRRFSTSLDG